MAFLEAVPGAVATTTPRTRFQWCSGECEFKSHLMSETVSTASSPAPSQPAPTLVELFIAFAAISICGFGGVLAWSRRMLVEQRRWMTADEFNEGYALCQFLPGPNVVNLSVVFGRQIRGPLGSVVALVGLIGPPFVIVTLIAVAYAWFGEMPALQRMLLRVAAAASRQAASVCSPQLAPR